MSRYSLSSTLALFQSVAAADPDATSSSTSSNSAINNSSGSLLSLSPSLGFNGSGVGSGSIEGGGGGGTINCGIAGGGVGLPAQASLAETGLVNTATTTTLYEQQIREPFKITNFKHQTQQPNISNHLLELQREIKEEEEEIFADINSLINNRSNLYSSFEDDTDEIEDNIGGRRGFNFVSGQTPIAPTATTNTSISCHSFSTTKNNNDISRHQDNSLFHDEDLGCEPDLIGNENPLKEHESFFSRLVDESGSSNNNQYHGQQHKFAPCNRYTGQRKQQQDEEEMGLQQRYRLGEQSSELKEQQQQQYLELDSELIHDHQQQLDTDDYHAIQRDIQQLTSSLPKPCVFFLEGNCRRSDCKYSHDLSSITCKYWIEGFCFKGEMCPFLHSFAPKGQDSGLMEDDLALSKREINPTFVIESEADFPSLPLDAPEVTLSPDAKKNIDSTSLTKTIKNQILSSNPAVVFKTTKKKRKKG